MKEKGPLQKEKRQKGAKNFNQRGRGISYEKKTTTEKRGKKKREEGKI